MKIYLDHDRKVNKLLCHRFEGNILTIFFNFTDKFFYFLIRLLTLLYKTGIGLISGITYYQVNFQVQVRFCILVILYFDIVIGGISWILNNKLNALEQGSAKC